MSTAAAIVVAAIVGALGWTLAEYVFHDFVGHRARGRLPGSREHLRHHAERDYFAPWTFKLRAAVLLAALSVPPLTLLLDLPVAIAGVVGFYGMYLIYELVHRRLHTHAPPHRYARLIRLHHFAHHFRRPNRNHGVTSPFWDVVFRTYEPPELPLRVPRKQAMRWLLDPESGDVRPEFASDYVVVGRAPTA